MEAVNRRSKDSPRGRSQSDPSEPRLAASTPSRRRLLVVGAAAGALTCLPSAWRRPVINSITIPAHAQTSDPPRPMFMLTGVTTALQIIRGTAVAEERYVQLSLSACGLPRSHAVHMDASAILRTTGNAVRLFSRVPVTAPSGTTIVDFEIDRDRTIAVYRVRAFEFDLDLGHGRRTRYLANAVAVGAAAAGTADPVRC